MACNCKEKGKYYVKAGESPDNEKVAKMVFTNAASNKDPIKEGKTIDWAITTEELHKESVEIACKLKNMLDKVNSSYSFAKVGDGLKEYEKYIDILCDEIEKSEPVSDEQKCKDNLNATENSDYDDLRQEKKDCNTETHKWDYTKCKCVEKKKEKKKEKIVKVIGCMDKTATNYDERYNTECDGCCTYNVPLAPISYNISFYELGEFPSGNKVTMNMDNNTYGICVRERAYNTIGDDGFFYGYQDESQISLNNIERDRFVFKGDVGFYDDPSDTLISDVKIAMTWYMHRVSKNNQNVGDDCILAPLNMNRIILEIKDSSGINHGVIRFGGENPTLRIDAPSPEMWLDYRSDNTPSGVANSQNNIKIEHVKEGRFYNLTCNVWNKTTSFTSKSKYECIENDGGWITISKVVSESKIGLGTLLGRKDKPNIGLGSLLDN